jgi:predicted Zn-dependent protease
MNLQGRKAAALDLMEKAFERSPGNFRVRSNLASLYAENGQVERAITILDDLTSDYPFYVNGWFNLALAQYRAGIRAEGLPGLTEDQIQQITRLKKAL